MSLNHPSSSSEGKSDHTGDGRPSHRISRSVGAPPFSSEEKDALLRWSSPAELPPPRFEPQLHDISAGVGAGAIGPPLSVTVDFPGRGSTSKVAASAAAVGSPVSAPAV
eukprot:424215-Prymnesium_polylepis.2